MNRITGTDVVREVAERWRLSPDAILGRDRDQRVCAARRAVILRLSDMGWPSSKTARLLGRNYTTITDVLGRRGVRSKAPHA